MAGAGLTIPRFETLDAYEAVGNLVRSYTKVWDVRDDLKVTALGHRRNVRLVVGKSPKLLGPGRESPIGHAATDRNVSTMRELGEALIAAADFVEGVNPKWSEGMKRHREGRAVGLAAWGKDES